jgi:transposase
MSSLPGRVCSTRGRIVKLIEPEHMKTSGQLGLASVLRGFPARWKESRRSNLSRRHRLDRGGNRQLNAAFYRIAITQARHYPPAREYLERKRGEGKSRRETIRCLKRQLARVVFNTLKASPALT